MKKLTWLMALYLFVGIAGAAAADTSISNLSGQSCGELSGTWHFVNNKTAGAGAGWLYATWSSGAICSVGASVVNRSTQHFYCSASGTLTSATTNLPGRLVLSDFTCEEKCTGECCDKTCEPPPK